MCLCWVVLLVVCAMIVLGELLFGGSSVCLLALGGFSLCACVCWLVSHGVGVMIVVGGL